MKRSGIQELRGVDRPVFRYATYGLRNFSNSLMVLYRRNRITGGTYFFTVTLRDCSSDVLVRHVGLLRNAFRTVRAERPFTIDAIVILPDHLHAVWTLPDGDADYSWRWRAIKSNFTYELRLSGMPLTPDKRGEYRLWQLFSLETEKTGSGVYYCIL
ncbi:MAG: hypothetical protein Q7T96_19155 [Methylobacter sp.]|nr:hypothetical protein [Methylobacter sp.]